MSEKKPVRITTLSENTAGQTDLLAEWGLSILVEADDQRFLLDSGESISLAQNAESLGIDLKTIDKAVLSHGHFDHTGGLRSLLQKVQHPLEIVAHPDVWAAKYSRRKDRPERYVGLPFQRQELESLGARFNLSRDPVQLSAHVQTTGEIPMNTDFESIDSGLVVRGEKGWEPDPLKDDLALIVQSAAGLIVVLGCAHRGAINTLERVRALCPGQKIYLVMGGAHLKDVSDEQIWMTVSALNEMGVMKLAVSHCTGPRAVQILSQTYGDNFLFNNTGSVIEAPAL
jgi:7,8-dihydropterin-6-yl-methyl-4-(beta-D-ribofuranosyl)aminobenzene 5'-phosphate synthase